MSSLKELIEKTLNEEVDDVRFYSNTEFKDDLDYITKTLSTSMADEFLSEMERARWGLSKRDVTQIFNTALSIALEEMRKSGDCVLFENYNETLGGDPEDFVSDIKNIEEVLTPLMSKMATHRAEGMIDDFLFELDNWKTKYER